MAAVGVSVLYGAYLAVCIGAFGSCWMVLNMAYRHGGINLVGWFFKGGPAVVYDTAVRNLEPAGIAWNELGSPWVGARYGALDLGAPAPAVVAAPSAGFCRCSQPFNE